MSTPAIIFGATFQRYVDWYDLCYYLDKHIQIWQCWAIPNRWNFHSSFVFETTTRKVCLIWVVLGVVIIRIYVPYSYWSSFFSVLWGSPPSQTTCFYQENLLRCIISGATSLSVDHTEATCVSSGVPIVSVSHHTPTAIKFDFSATSRNRAKYIHTNWASKRCRLTPIFQRALVLVLQVSNRPSVLSTVPVFVRRRAHGSTQQLPQTRITIVVICIHDTNCCWSRRESWASPYTALLPLIAKIAVVNCVLDLTISVCAVCAKGKREDELSRPSLPH